jgi:beta-aspartyl-peptidase (threonine type)
MAAFANGEKPNSWGRMMLDHEDAEPQHKFGTIGAVARDIHGNLAAATSTGGHC